MTEPKNTPQDERDPVVLAEANADAKRPRCDNDWRYIRDAFLNGFAEGRLGYVPNQTVVAIAEAARKEERERCEMIAFNAKRRCTAGTPMWHLANETEKLIANPPESE